jgi:hypothetical protein
MIDTQKLEAVFVGCFFKDDELKDLKTGEVPAGCVHVEGIVNRFGLHPERLEAARTKVVYWLKQLPTEFRAEMGGGWTFLNACQTKDGEQWGEHRNMEQLFCLGLGLKLVTEMMPRQMWKMLPGGMPYYSIIAGIDILPCATDEEIAAIQVPELPKFNERLLDQAIAPVTE